MTDVEKNLTATLTEIVCALVDEEDAVDITAMPSGTTIMFNIDAAKGDVGKLIGRQGKTAGAIRHIMSAASAKYKVRSIISIPDKKDQ